MRVLFDGYWWNEGPHSNRTVQREIVNAWIGLQSGDELHVLGRGRPIEGLPHGVTYHATPNWMRHPVSNAVGLRVVARRIKADAIVGHNFGAGRRSLTFIHDLIFLEHPQWFTLLERLYLSLIGPMSRGSLLLTSSQAEARRIDRLLKPRVETSPVGLALPPELESEPVRPAGVPDNFFLTVGRLNVRKNLRTVLQAAAASAIVGPEVPLVVVGSAHGRSDSIDGLARHLSASGRLVSLATCTGRELAWLYQNAIAFISMSLDEGFGMPLLEARHFRTPLIVGDTVVAQEIAGPNSTYVGVLDSDALARAMDRHVELLRPEPISRSWSDVTGRIRELAAQRVSQEG
jgi:glycosyltransferase involved in cell wall biosynthesis